MDVDDDYLTCGKCMTEFKLDKITSFIRHKKQDCQETVEDSVSFSQAELICTSCTKGFMTAVGLLRHAQTIHKLKLFLENNVGVTGFRGVHIPSENEGMEVENSLLSKYAIYSSSDEPIISDINSENDSNKSALKYSEKKIMNNDNQLLAGSDTQIYFPETFEPPNSDNLSDVLSRENSISATNKTVSSTVLGAIMKSGVIFPVMNRQVNEPAYSEIQGSRKLLTNINAKTTTPQLTGTQVNPFTSISTSPKLCTDESAKPQFVEKHHTVKDSIELQSDKYTNTQLTDLQPSQLPFAAVNNHLIDTSEQCSTVNMTSSQVDQEVSPVMGLVQKSDDQSPVFVAEISHVSNLLQRMASSVTSKCIEKDNNKLSETSGVQGSAIQNEGSRETNEISNEDNEIKCCNNQKCGVTVIPGTHEGLKKCCNAVVPKKRKRHFETKHTSSMRPKLSRRLSAADLSKSHRNLDKKNCGTIFIDLEPNDDGSLSQKSNTSDPNFAVSTDNSEIGFEVSGLCRENYTSQSKPKGKGSVILKPGAIFSIPIAYSLTTQHDGSLPPLVISKHTFQSDGKSSSKTITADIRKESNENFANVTGSRIETIKGDNSSSSVKISPLSLPVKVLDNRLEMNINQTSSKCTATRRRRYPTSKPFKCDKCDSAFNQRIHLKKHMSKHTGVKPFKCQQCNYSTVERSHLKVHIRIHTGEKPFKCTYCEYATAQNSTLKIHLKRHHKPFQDSTTKPDS